MSRHKKIIIGITLLVLIIIGLALLLIKGAKEEEGLVERSGLPKEEWLRAISVEEKDNFKVISNKVDGYRITVPAAWDTETEVSPGSGHHIAYLTDNNDSLSLRTLKVENIDQAKDYFPDTARFETIKTAQGVEVYKTTSKMTEERFDPKVDDIVEAPIENSLSVGFIVSTDKNTYIIFCNTLGSDYEALASQCEGQVINTFTILN